MTVISGNVLILLPKLVFKTQFFNGVIAFLITMKSKNTVENPFQILNLTYYHFRGTLMAIGTLTLLFATLRLNLNCKMADIIRFENANNLQRNYQVSPSTFEI